MMPLPNARVGSLTPYAREAGCATGKRDSRIIFALLLLSFITPNDEAGREPFISCGVCAIIPRFSARARMVANEITGFGLF